VAILLIRHGETALNAARVIQMPETPLSARGCVQAEHLGRRLSRDGVARIVSSDFARAVMTAERVREHTGAPLALDPLLQERNFGALRGTPYAELAEDPFAPAYVPPGGESWDAFHVRVEEAWVRIREHAAQTAGNLAVVTHGLVCHSLVRRCLGETTADPEVVGFPNTALTVVESSPPWRVQLLACTVHLDGKRDEGAPA
jgi:broad specificity phosphatase PhoE